MGRVDEELRNAGESPLFDSVDEVVQYESPSSLTPKDFFTQHLLKSRPFYIKGLARKWPAFKRWPRDEYLIDNAGDDQIDVEEIDRAHNEFAYFLKKYGRQKMTYGEFMQRMANESRTRNYYFAEQEVPVMLQKDIVEPVYGAELMTPQAVYYWDGIGTVSLPH